MSEPKSKRVPRLLLLPAIVAIAFLGVLLWALGEVDEAKRARTRQRETRSV